MKGWRQLQEEKDKYRPCNPSARRHGYSRTACALFVKPQGTPLLQNPAGRPDRTDVVENLESAERLFVLIALESRAHGKRMLLSQVILLVAVTINGR